jgi:hypothetical protein
VNVSQGTWANLHCQRGRRMRQDITSECLHKRVSSVRSRRYANQAYIQSRANFETGTFRPSSK